MKMTKVQLHTTDYILAGAFLCVSLGIGIFHGVFRKAKTTDDYLYGNHKMHLLPVALSLLVTFQSATSCLGIPAEIYTYSTMIFYGSIGQVLATGITAVTIVPLLYPLKLNSAYEYFGRRFNSRSVQLLGTFIGMFQTLLYMSVVLLSPALALEAVAGIPLWVSVVVVGVIGTIYTSMGGFRSVIWTDVFQFVIMYAGLTVILILGIVKVGSIGKILELSKDGDRISFNASFDPRIRHSLWSCLLGGMFGWFPNTCQQSAVQRMTSMRNQRDAKIAVLLNMPFTLLFVCVLMTVGLVFYAYFAVELCDPIRNGDIGSPNQLMPYFVMLVLNNVPGLAGLFLAALFSGALSSLSSGINALAANTLQDLLIGCTGRMSQARKTLWAKVIVIIYGTLAIIIAYLMKSLTGPVTQIASTAFGACGGPYFGIFCLGAMFPQANWKGALVGGAVGIIFNIWLAVGAIFHATPSPRSPPLPVSGCRQYPPINQTMSLDPYTIHQQAVSPNPSSFVYFESTNDSTSTAYTVPFVESNSRSGLQNLYDLSYLYYGLTGFLVTLVIGLLVSIATGRRKYDDKDARYLFPCLRSVWGLRHQQDNGTEAKRISLVNNDDDASGSL